MARKICNSIEGAQDPEFKRSDFHYHFIKTYKIKSVNGTRWALLLKSDLKMLPLEDFFDITHESHSKTSHRSPLAI